jgi:hypothetical protein
VWVVAATVITALWVAAALAGGDASPVDTTATGAAAAAGTAAAVGAAWGFGPIRPLWLAGLTLILLPIATAAVSEGSAPVLPISLLVLAAGEVVSSLTGLSGLPGRDDEVAGWGVLGSNHGSPDDEVAREEIWAQAGLVLVATGLLVGAIAAGHEDNGAWALVADGGSAAAFGLSAAAVLLASSAFGPTRGRAYAVPGLLVGMVVAPGVSALTLAIVGGGLAVLSAALVGRRPGVALGFLGLGAAAFSAGRPAAALLLAGAALALSYGGDHPAAGLLGLPGAAALGAEALTAGGGATPVVLVTAAAVTAALLVAAATRVTQAIQLAPIRVLEPGSLPWASIPAAALGIWLLVAPGTWGWTGATGLGAYDRGAAPAAAVACAVVVLKAAFPRDDQEPTEPPGSGWSRAASRA